MQKTPDLPPAFMVYEREAAPCPTLTYGSLAEALWNPHVDNDTLVTFMISVPLEDLVNGRVYLIAACEEAFDGKLRIGNAEFRAIGDISGNEGFGGEFVGNIPLQVTCTLSTLAD